ncbi:universal stress protein [Gramella jeungdoensis]|uniref:Universal stress protein n=1 Tax=Gramella jeungdoensis TaxID=708091 RepID=A0ABT0Z0P3_9FLAO|nr:universal stress protein [Gramella jeungdoensis]MCM8569302.1 universal stress protein [Gramella jeungdoensis]
MNTILVPVDFSEYSEYALEVAASIARKQNADIVVVHMMDLPESFLTKDEKQEVFNAIYFMKLTKQRFDKFLDKDYMKDIEVTQAVRNYKVFSEINDVAKEYEADLIVMGSHGASGFKEIFVGSNTEKVVRTSETPVLVIKKQISNFKLENAVFVTEFDPETLDAFLSSRQFFQLFDVDPKLLFVNVPEKFMSTKEMIAITNKFLEDAGLDAPEIKDRVIYYDDYSLEKGIFNYCNSVKADIIAMPTHGRKGIAHFFYGSIGEDIANHADIPVLTFKL